MAKKKEKKEKKRTQEVFTTGQLKEYTLEIFKRDPLKAFNYKQVAKRLGISNDAIKEHINQLLYDLTENEQLEEVYLGKFKYKTIGGYVTGTLEMTSYGTAYVICESLGEDVFISRNNMHHALHGDEVQVYLFARRRKHKLEGEITDIIKRSKNTFVGTVEISRNYAFLVPDSKTMPYDIFIPLAKINNAKNKQKAIAVISEWLPNAKNPTGEIVEVLGEAGDNDVEMHAILNEYDLPHRFDDVVIQAAELISDVITPEEIKRRRDFRQITTLTIDPEDAKDFDDALSYRELANGNFEIGVHIADVTHYVKPDSIVDQEAQSRGTSVYLVDRVVPMLPERLSNYICSLRPNEDKLTFSAVFEVDIQANIINQWFGRTIINSNKRFSYEEAQQVIENGEGELKHEILTLHRIAQILRKRRYANGSIGFERVEIKFKLDENSKPIDVYFKEQKEANQLIEEFMLLANRRVAEYIGKPPTGKAKTFVYRIHDVPNPDKLEAFAEFIKRFGYSIKIKSQKQVYDSINQLLIDVEGKSEQNIIEQLAIRSMAKAMYSTNNIGHYGLAFTYYTHFTSPIRRYPDMMVHLLLDKYLSGEKSVSEVTYEALCKHSSEMERKSVMAERASEKYKQVEFMSDKVGEVYDGIISGVTEWGMYVEIVQNKIEGLISLRSLNDDYYVFDEKHYCLVGSRTHKKYNLGDAIKIRVAKVNMERRQLDFTVCNEFFYT